MKCLVDSIDLASEIDLQRAERMMSRHKKYTFEVIYSPYVLLVWKDSFGTVRVSYFERKSEADIKKLETILNQNEVVHADYNVRFPFALFTVEQE